MLAPSSPDLVKLTWHVRGWMKRIGKTATGTKAFYFGRDLASAKVAAWEKMKLWDMRPQRVQTWEHLEEVLRDCNYTYVRGMREALQTTYNRIHGIPDPYELIPDVPHDDQTDDWAIEQGRKAWRMVQELRAG